MIQLLNTDGTGFTVAYLNGLVQTLLDTIAAQGSVCISGLSMEVDSGLNLQINEGSFVSTQVAVVEDPIIVAVADASEKYVWIDLDQAITFTDTWAEVTDNRVCLGRVTTSGGAITKVRYDRRMQNLRGAWDSEKIIPVTSGDYVLTPDQFTYPNIKLTGTLAGAVNVILPEWPGTSWTFNNATNNTYPVKVIDYQDNDITLAVGYRKISDASEGVHEK